MRSFYLLCLIGGQFTNVIARPRSTPRVGDFTGDAEPGRREALFENSQQIKRKVNYISLHERDPKKDSGDDSKSSKDTSDDSKTTQGSKKAKSSDTADSDGSQVSNNGNNTSIQPAGANSSSSQTTFWIRHGEKPATGDGLDAQGVARSKCLPAVFGKTSSFNIGKIMAQTPLADGSRQRPLDTIQPLADSLGMKVDTSCDRDDPQCVANAINNFKGPGNVLVCWEHKAIQDNMAALGAKDAPAYPSQNFDLIFTQAPPFTDVSQPKSEGCPGIDASKLRRVRRL